VQSDAELFDRFMLTFSSSMAYMMVRHREPWGERFTAIHLEGINNNSKLEGGELDEREIRHTFNARVEAWLFFTPDEITTVKKFIREYYSYGGKDVGTHICPPSVADFLEEQVEEFVAP